MNNTTQKIWDLFRDDEGTSVVELAILSPFAAVLLLGMIDTSFAFTEKLKTEQAAQRAVEKATAFSGAGSDYSGLDDEAAQDANVPRSAVTMDKWLECDGTRQANFNGICANDELISRHISITIDNSYTPLFNYGPIGRLAQVNNNGTIPYSVDAQVRIQ
jgi:Flp pilus assembly protein TadG